MKRLCIISLVSLATVSMANSAHATYTSEMRSRIAQVMAENAATSNALDLGEWTLFLQNDTAFTDLVGRVACSPLTCCSNFTAIATNELQRRILLATGWYCGTNGYLTFLERLAPKWRDEALPTKEFRWFEAAPDQAWNMFLVRNHAVPAISNLVLGLQCALTNDAVFEAHCTRILSGEAAKELQMDIEAGFAE